MSYQRNYGGGLMPLPFQNNSVKFVPAASQPGMFVGGNMPVNQNLGMQQPLPQPNMSTGFQGGSYSQPSFYGNPQMGQTYPSVPPPGPGTYQSMVNAPQPDQRQFLPTPLMAGNFGPPSGNASTNNADHNIESTVNSAMKKTLQLLDQLQKKQAQQVEPRQDGDYKPRGDRNVSPQQSYKRERSPVPSHAPPASRLRSRSPVNRQQWSDEREGFSKGAGNNPGFARGNERQMQGSGAFSRNYDQHNIDLTCRVCEMGFSSETAYKEHCLTSLHRSNEDRLLETVSSRKASMARQDLPAGRSGNFQTDRIGSDSSMARGMGDMNQLDEDVSIYCKICSQVVSFLDWADHTGSHEHSREYMKLHQQMGQQEFNKEFDVFLSRSADLERLCKAKAAESRQQTGPSTVKSNDQPNNQDTGETTYCQACKIMISRTFWDTHITSRIHKEHCSELMAALGMDPKNEDFNRMMGTQSNTPARNENLATNQMRAARFNEPSPATGWPVPNTFQSSPPKYDNQQRNMPAKNGQVYSDRTFVQRPAGQQQMSANVQRMDNTIQQYQEPGRGPRPPIKSLMDIPTPERRTNNAGRGGFVGNQPPAKPLAIQNQPHGSVRTRPSRFDIGPSDSFNRPTGQPGIGASSGASRPIGNDNSRNIEREVRLRQDSRRDAARSPARQQNDRPRPRDDRPARINEDFRRPVVSKSAGGIEPSETPVPESMEAVEALVMEKIGMVVNSLLGDILTLPSEEELTRMSSREIFLADRIHKMSGVPKRTAAMAIYLLKSLEPDALASLDDML